MMHRFKLRPIPSAFADRFPDGDYTIGRGADPRGIAERGKATIANAQQPKKPRKRGAPKRVVKSAAE